MISQTIKIKTKTYSANSMWFAHKNFKRTVTADSSTYWTENNTYSDMVIKSLLTSADGDEYKTVITINKELLPTRISNATLRLATKSDCIVNIGTKAFIGVANQRFDVDITDQMDDSQVVIEITGGSATEPTFLHTTGDLAPSLELTYVATTSSEITATLYSVSRTSLQKEQVQLANTNETTFALCKLENIAEQDLSNSTKVVVKFPVLHIEGSRFYNALATETGTHETMFNAPTANMVYQGNTLYYIADVTPLVHDGTLYFAVERCDGDAITLGEPIIEPYPLKKKEVSSEGANLQHNVGSHSQYTTSLFDGRMQFSQNLFSAHGQLAPLQLSLNYHVVRGWKFSVEQEVIPELSHISWIDGSNKEHVFVRSKNNNSVYVDSSSKAGIILSHLNTGYEITDDKGTTMMFNNDGKLYKVQQKVGASQYVSTNIIYQNGKISQVVDGMGTTYVWDYSTENICSIKKGNDTLCTVHFNAKQQVIQVTYPSGITSKFTYAINGLLNSAKDSSTSNLVEFDYDEMWNVASIKHFVQKSEEKFPTMGYTLSYSLFEEGSTKQLSTTINYYKNGFESSNKYMCKRFNFSLEGTLLYAGDPDQTGRMIVLNKEDYSSHFATLDDEPKVFEFDSLAGYVPEFVFPNKANVGIQSTRLTTEEDDFYFSNFVFATTVEVTEASEETNERIKISLLSYSSREKIATIYVKPYVTGKQTIFLDVNLDTTSSQEYVADIDCKPKCSAKVHSVCLYKVKQNPKLQVVNLDTGSLDSVKVFDKTPNYWHKMANCTITCGEHVAEDAKFTTKDYLLTLCSKMANANFFNVWYNDGSQCFVDVSNARFTFENGETKTLNSIILADVSTQHNITSLQYATLKNDGLYVHNQVHNGTEFQQSYSKMDSLFRTVKTEDANGVVTEYVFDAFSNVTKQTTYHKDTPSKAIKWETVQSEDGKLTTADKSFYLLDTHTTSYAYNADNMLQSVTEPNGQAYNYTYDTDKTQQVKVESMLDNQTHQTGVNLQNGVCQSMYDTNNTYYLGYDQRNNVATVSTNGVTLLSKQHTYLPNGVEQILSTFANGYKQRNTYNCFGKLLLVEDVTNATAVPLVTYIYSDVALDETTIEVSSPTDSRLVVSENSRLRKVIDYASGKTSTYYYDQAGNLSYTRDNLVETSIYEKDDYNRPTKTAVTFDKQYIDFAYNYKSPFDSTLIEESAKTEDKTFITTYQTDSLQRPTETQVLVGVNGYKTIYYYAPQNEQYWVETGEFVNSTSSASPKYVPEDSFIGEDGHWETRDIGTTTKISSISRYNIKNGVPTVESFENIKYDANGNLTQCGGTIYVYDKLNRLVRENNSALDKTFVWCYDIGGNILSRTEYDYTTGDLTDVVPTATFAYEYERGWKDQLTSFAGQPIVYANDSIPVFYKNMHLGWSRNGLLTTASTTNTAIAMQYNATGVRFRKFVWGTGVYSTTDYTYAGNKLVRETKGGTLASTKTYLYNSQGIIGFVQDGLEYIYHQNIFGDIVAIYQGSTKIAEYAYDAWGNCTIVSDTGNIGRDNPFRYRGYYWDNDLNLYYIQGRYYDPQTGRFIQPTDISSINASIINGLNLYAYVLNNPITYKNVISSENAETSECIANSFSHICNGNNPRYAASIPCPAVPSELKQISKLNEIFATTAHVFIVSKYLLRNLAFLDEMRLFGRNPAKVLGTLPRAAWINKLGYVFSAIDAGITIYDNLQQGNSFEHALLDGALTFGIDAASAWVGGFVGSNVGGWIGAFLGSLIPIPYVGPLIGFVLGTCVGLVAAWFVDDVLNRLKDGLLDLLFE